MPCWSAIKVGLGRSTPFLVTLDGLDVFPSLASTIAFPELIGGGERTEVYRNKEMGLIPKVYAMSERDTFQMESRLLRKANDISPQHTPHFFGCYESSTTGKAILIMADAGEPVRSLTDLSPSQRYDVLPWLVVMHSPLFREQLATCVQALHAGEIHHHDIAARNVLVDSQGSVTLIDLNVAEEITGKCICCPDEEVLEDLEESEDSDVYDGV
jgi:tRNA A-37 threonylcarbamoyl transferase component Bud32